MTYVVDWGRDDNETPVSTVDELDAVLDQIGQQAAQHGPIAVDVFPDDDQDGTEPDYVPYGLEIGIGYPDRSYVSYTGEPASGFAYDPDLPPLEDTRTYNYGGEPAWYDPEHTRITPQQARDAAREYVRTGQRPACVRWND